jgi:tetratricopeptide (TPR) repeat protein
MDEPLTPAGADTRVVLEENRRLSESMIWGLQRNFFDRRSFNAWVEGVLPHYVTSNPFIANAYARTVFGFLRDCQAVARGRKNAGFPPLDPDQPVYVVELGSGTGRFAFHFLKKLLDLKNSSALKNRLVKYVMTDLAERNVEFWSSHPALRPFVEEGVLDFARFDLERDEEIRLSHSGETLTAESFKNPLVLIANYVFDSIPQDLFYFEGGELHECLVTLSSAQEDLNPDDPEFFRRVQVSYEHYAASPEYYDDPELNRILQEYRQRLAGTTIPFPCAALRCLRRLARLARGRMLLLSADKGYVGEETLLHTGQPELSIHGSFSMMVNYHAIGRYFENQGGHVLHTPHRYNSLNISAYLLGPHPSGYAETRQAFVETIENCGPDDFFTLIKGVAKNYDALTLEQLLALLRLSAWDAKIFNEAFPSILNRVESAPPPLKEEVYSAIQKVWDNYYHIGEEGDIAFNMAMLLYGMQYYPEALEYFGRSLQLWGADPSTLYNMAMCHYGLSELDVALECIERTLELDSTFEEAKAMRIKFQAEIERHARQT